jgi:putative ABC transport system permease protein
MRTLREWLLRLWGSVRRHRADDDLEAELRAHLEMAGADGRTTRREAGGVTLAMDSLRDQRGWPWLDALRADAVFGWRQLKRHRTTTIAALVSLALAIGATTAAYRLIDAVLLRPLPIAHPDRLSVITTTETSPSGQREEHDYFDYPTFRQYAAAIGDAADLLVVGMSAPVEVTIDNGDAERARRQFVSGNVFRIFGLQPTAGRLITESDDEPPGAHPAVVLSHEYWRRRFRSDPGVVGSTLRVGSRQLQVVGVASAGFTGTEPGILTDLFVPASMNVAALNSPGWAWFRLWVHPRAGTSANRVEQQLDAAFASDRVRLRPAGAGVSDAQRDLRRPLWLLAALVAVVLLIACANVANLLTTRAVTRAREMALRVSIGAGRARLVQLVLVESAMLAVGATAIGALLAAWCTPSVLSLLAPPEEPIRLVLDVDWRALAFGSALAILVTALFGLGPALRASGVTPIGALRGTDAPARSRFARTLVAVQTAFCVFVLAAATLLVTTFARLSAHELGFSTDRVVVLDLEARAAESWERWLELASGVRAFPGVDAVAVAGWAPLSENRWSATVHVVGRPAEPRSPYFLGVSPGFFNTLGIGLVDGRDFRRGDTQPTGDSRAEPATSVGIVNESFARVYFDGANPVGRSVGVRVAGGSGSAARDTPMQIVGLVRDAAYWSVREPMRPIVYVPLEAKGDVSILARVSGDPAAIAESLPRAFAASKTGVRAGNSAPLSAFARRQMVRERLLATVSLFFAGLGVLLSTVGLYGVLNHAVLQRRREIGVRLALGAGVSRVVRGVAGGVMAAVCLGTVVGLACGLLFGRVADALLYQIVPTDPVAMATPIATVVVMAAFAAAVPAIRVARINPAQTLRAE